MKIILATRNKGKIREINAIFSGTEVVFEGMDAYPDIPDVAEDGMTFQENAVKKARAVFDATGKTVVSEDSGLEVDALDGAPGIYSARFASEDATDEENVRKLLSELKGLEKERRAARFVSVFCLYDGKEERFFEGSVKGGIVETPRGTSGFGYDPLFVPEGHEKTFAELGANVKNRISHRARAIEKLKAFLEARGS